VRGRFSSADVRLQVDAIEKIFKLAFADRERRRAFVPRPRDQRNLKTPVPASTQWEVVRDHVDAVVPVHDELERRAVSGRVMHNDDTSVWILEFMGKRRAKLVAYDELPVPTAPACSRPASSRSRPPRRNRTHPARPSPSVHPSRFAIAASYLV